MNNIYDDIPDVLEKELFEPILEREGFRIERIVSFGHGTPSGQWLSQKEDEWVIVLEGEAEISFSDGSPNCRMKPGDHIFIASGREHRVEWSAPEKRTVWLAVHSS